MNMEDDLKHDSIEDDPNFQPMIEAAEKDADAQLANHPERNRLGFCHLFWKTKKQILRDKYGIKWRSPQEMNPDVAFD
jgi:hypothetical protein